VFLLGLTAAEEGYASPYRGTYRQISELGGQVRRGERSTLVTFWKRAEHAEADPHTGEPATRQLPVLRYYRVFNAAQADRLPGRFYPEPGQDHEITAPQEVLDRYLTEGPKLLHVPGDRADYHPASDTIRLPLRSQFRSAENYYATAFHETGHSTGHPDRLNRPGVAAFDHFGSGQYAREELTAQMTSSVLCVKTGIENPEIFDNSASYIAGWLSALNDDKRLVITAAAQAQHATDLITDPERQPAKDNEQHSRSPASRQQIRDAEPAGTIPGTALPSDYSYLGDRSRPPEAAEQSGDWQAEAG
jgi:antirestriction protein ArdC